MGSWGLAFANKRFTPLERHNNVFESVETHSMASTKMTRKTVSPNTCFVLSGLTTLNPKSTSVIAVWATPCVRRWISSTTATAF